MNKKNRIFVSNLLNNILVEKLNVIDALRMFPKDYNDKSLDVVFHAIVHYEADEDIRHRDLLYKEEQDSYIEMLSQTLKNGDGLPLNIIAEYEKLYPEIALYKKDNQDNVIRRLFKKINL